MQEKLNVTFSAEYLVPAYNMPYETQYINNYSNPNTNVHLWAVRAERGREAETIRQSLAQEQANYERELKINPENRTLRRGLEWMKTLQSLLANPVFHKPVDAALRDCVAHDLMRAGLDANVNRAVYLAGVSAISKSR